ncbi:hypothetical protein FB45DRAFT_902526, partial [Roridomyces roridus]
FFRHATEALLYQNSPKRDPSIQEIYTVSDGPRPPFHFRISLPNGFLFLSMPPDSFRRWKGSLLDLVHAFLQRPATLAPPGIAAYSMIILFYFYLCIRPPPTQVSSVLCCLFMTAIHIFSTSSGLVGIVAGANSTAFP